ncbi:hypothetical protein [Eubacterium sp. LMAG:50]|uniref:hypothetical protein n=1 Tax=Eubacterium sp. LMAG:50 TaxID=1969563 RepID=UPI0025C03F5D|nr:hypothetical protein [Eubacterium sp. LMAG:50]
MKKLINSKKTIATIIIGAYIIILIISMVVGKHLTLSDKLEKTYYISQIISSIFVVSGVVIAVWQYYLSKKAENRQLKLITIQKSVDLAEYYKDNILNLYEILHFVYGTTGISELLDKIDYKKMKEFDKTECDEIVSVEIQNKLKDIQESDKMLNSILNANNMFGLNLNFVRVEKKDGEKSVLINKKNIMTSFAVEVKNKLLNNLEFFAMHFEHNTADETVVYQSLHQTYIEIVRMMYYNIAQSNETADVHFYSNIIGVYKLWNERKYQAKKEIIEKARNMTNRGNVVE